MESQIDPLEFSNPIQVALAGGSSKSSERNEDSGVTSLRPVEACVAVFDGMGGSGSRGVVTRNNDGTSEAYHASRRASQATMRWWNDNSRRDLSPEKLSGNIFEELRLAASELTGPQDGPVVRSTMLKSFPTTAAIAVLQVDEPSGTVAVTAMWAGDSRVYLVSPEEFIQLTIDDVQRGLDPFELLSHDTPISKHFSADLAVQLRSNIIKRIRKPLVVFAASDGIFNYWSTPWEFELVVRKCLRGNSSIQAFAESLSNECAAVSKDDYTVACISVDYSEFFDHENRLEMEIATLEALQERFKSLRERRSQLIEESETLETDIQDIWNRYKISYLTEINEIAPTNE